MLIVEYLGIKKWFRIRSYKLGEYVKKFQFLIVKRIRKFRGLLSIIIPN